MSDFQSHGAAQGRVFEEQCNVLLRASGFELHGKLVLREIGVEVDCEAAAPSGARIWFEYKGSVQGSRPGLLRTDTLKKAIANGALIAALGEHPPYVVLASHLPTKGAGLAMLREARRAGYFADVVCINDPRDTARLRAL